MNAKYAIILFWSEDDQAFVAEVPELPGCMAHGDSQESALASVNEAIALWIAAAKELDRVVPSPNSKRSTYA